MKTIITIALLFAACTNDNNTTQGMTPIELCGNPPLAPGFSVAYGSDGYARLPNDQMHAISDFFNGQYDTWANCILSIK